MTNLDRFSRPLAGENKFNSEEFNQMIEEQRYYIKRDLVKEHVWDYVDEYNSFPTIDAVVDFFSDIYIDQDLVKDALTSVQSMTKLPPVEVF